MDRITETRKIPLSFINSSFDPCFGIVVIFAWLKKYGIFVPFFILLNIFKSEFFKSSPITSGLKMSLSKPSWSLDLFFFKYFRAFSKSGI